MLKGWVVSGLSKCRLISYTLLTQAEVQALEQQVTNLSHQKAELEKDKAKLVASHEESLKRLKHTFNEDKNILQLGKSRFIL